MSTRRFLSLSVFAFTLLAVLALPATAEAQRRAHRGRVHSSIIISGGYGYPGIWFYDQWGPWGPWGPYGPYRPYSRYLLDDFSASLKFDVRPKDAEVYIDGALAGEIDDFDGIFQSLKVRPGNHEIVVYRDGFRSVREQLYIEPYHQRKLRFDLQPLAPGEAPELRPQGPTGAYGTDDPRGRGRDPRQVPPRRPEPRMPPPEPPRPPQPAQFGTLSLRVVPADAEVLIDGERWTSPSGSDRLTIQLAPGRHRVEVRKQGLQTYTEEVLIRQGATMALNVSLK